MRTMRLLIAASFLVLLSCSGDQIPRTPGDIQYKPLTYQPPSLVRHRHTLDNGITVFIVPDPKLPVFDLHARIRAAGLYEPRKGVAALTAGLLTDGGTTQIKPDSLDELLEFHAISLSSGGDLTGSLVSVSALSEKTDLALSLFNAVLREPAFYESRLALAKKQYVEAALQRFDNPKSALNILRDWAIYGLNKKSELYSVRDIQNIGRGDLQRFYRDHFRPENIVLGVSGRFDPQEILKKLNATLGAWKPAGTGETPFPELPVSFKKGFYFVEKDINQAYVKIGLPMVQRPHPDYYPLALMNWILGGGSFTSRITRKVREEEGLAYSAGTWFQGEYFFPGSFHASLETKSASAAYAIDLVFAEFRKFLKEGPTDEELSQARESLIEAFPSSFNTGDQTARAFTRNQYQKEDEKLFDLYRDRIRAVTQEDIRKAALRHLKPDSMAVCIVGKFADCEKGDGVHPAKLADFGTPKRMTLKELSVLLGGE